MRSFKYYRNRIKWRLLMPILRAKNIDTKNSIFIFSEPRGGSTWLMEILAQLPQTACIFEPLHSHYGALENYTWGNHQRISDTWPEGRKGINEILNTNSLDSYQLERSPALKLITAKQFVFKCVMANPLMPWIVQHFEFNYKPIFILRHPLSVASSTLENLYKRGEKINIDHKWEPTGYNKKLFDKNKDLFSEDSPVIDQLIARWCINNHYALNQEQNWITVYYENMLLYPQETISRIFKEWPIDQPKNICSDFDKPSHSDFTNDFRKDKKDQLSKWINKYSSSELRRFQTILDRFDITLYRMDDPQPRLQSEIKKGYSEIN